MAKKKKSAPAKKNDPVDGSDAALVDASDDAANDPPVVHRGATPLQLPDAPPWPELQATPTLGYNGWLTTTNGGKVHANQTLYYRIADKLVSSGLAAAGYDTLLTVCMI